MPNCGDAPSQLPTAVAAAAALDCEQGAIADSVVFDTAGKPRLALASGAHRVDTKKLAQRLGTAKIRRPPLTLSSSTSISVRAASPRSDTPDQSCPAAGSLPETYLGVPKSSSSLKCAPIVIKCRSLSVNWGCRGYRQPSFSGLSLSSLSRSCCRARVRVGPIAPGGIPAALAISA